MANNTTDSASNSPTYTAADGYWYYDGSTVYIQFGEIMGGDGSHYLECRFRGQFENGRATILGAKGSKWSKTCSEDWVLADDAIIVDGGSYVWRR